MMHGHMKLKLAKQYLYLPLNGYKPSFIYTKCKACAGQSHLSHTPGQIIFISVFKFLYCCK